MISTGELLIDEPATCAGFSLSPLTLGHYLLLSIYKSPFVDYSWDILQGDNALHDLCSAITICRVDYDVALRWFINPSGGGMTPEHEKTWRGIEEYGADVLDVCETFQAWFLRHTEVPETVELKPIPGVTNLVGSDFSLRVISSAVKILGINKDEALRTSYALLIRAHIHDLEERGICEIIDDDRRAQIEEAKQRTEWEAEQDGQKS